MPHRHEARPSSREREGARRRRWVAVGLAVALVTVAGCGARWDDEQRAAVVARNQGAGTGAAGGARAGGASSDLAADDPAAADTQGADPAAAAGGPQAAAGPGAEGAGAGPEAAAAKPCAAPSDAPGVTDGQITIGSISSVSGPVPGLGATSLGAVRAYVAYRNSTGGVCGRELVLKGVDDGMDNGRYRAALQDLDPQVLGLAGGLSTGDAGGTEVAERLQTPIVNTPISTTFEKVSTVFDINPPFADVNAVIGKYRYLKDNGASRAALVYTAADQTREEVRDKQKPQMLAAGIEVVHEAELPLSTLSFDSAARGVANSKADFVLVVLEAGQSAGFAKSLHETGHEPKFEEYLIAYGTSFVELAGPAAEGAINWIRTLPNEEPNTTPEQQAYLAWMARVAPDLAPDVFSADAWASVKAFVDALEALPGPITRDALIAQLRSVGDYDAGGLLGPIELGPKRNKGCFIAMQVVSGTWKRMAPANGFLC